MIKVGDIVYHRDDHRKNWFLVVSIDKTGCVVFPIKSGEVQPELWRHSRKRNLKKIGEADIDITDILEGRRKSIV